MTLPTTRKLKYQAALLAAILRSRRLRREAAWAKADTTKDRLYTRTGVEHYEPNTYCYQVWLALPKGVVAAMRNAGDMRPVYEHDLVDRL